MFRSSVSVRCLLLVAVAPALGQPAHVIMIRHGEKDPDDTKDNGLTWQGKARAAALVPYFEAFLAARSISKPVWIFAQSAPDPARNSLRPILTVHPYAASIGLAGTSQFVTDRYRSDQHAELVQHLLEDSKGEYKGRTVLICWEHDHLAKMANNLVKQVVGMGYKVNVKKKLEWPGGDVYGITWTFALNARDGTCEFNSYSQQLMYNDAMIENSKR